MATTTPQASQAWHNALKLRKHLLKQLDKIKNNNGAGVDIAQLEAADGTLEKFRLACVQTVFLDFEYAVNENTEEILWNLHTSINSEYRRILGRLKSSSQAVERRKTEKLYSNFLRIAQKFYQGYIQRLAARYDIPELRRVARGIDVEQMTATGDSISPVPSELNAKVLRSCHATLIRLGDLARYRVQAKHKNSGYDMALTYYTLAQHLLPKSGFAFHQMGIVSLDQSNHLDGVYHFYRAWAIKFPHPNAKPNLEMEFKSLQQPSSNKSKHASSGPQDAFIMWFVRLHALFYKGEAAPQYKELEREVIHRLEMAAATGTCRDVLLKMSFINMAAQYIAALKCSESKSSTALQFYQYICNFNIKFLTTFASVLESNLKEAISNAEEPPEDPDSKTAQVTESLLPTLRVYSMWIAASREELFSQAAAAAEGSPTAIMMDTIARVFTLMCVETYNRDNLVSCPYLLPEDLDILGFQPLSEAAVPEACRAFCMHNGKVKPHLHSPEQRLDAQSEKLARILDILRCAYFLAEDAAVPLSYRVVDNFLLFEHQSTDAAAARQTEAPSSLPAELPAPRKEATAGQPATINVQKRRSVAQPTASTNQSQQTSPKILNGKQPEALLPSIIAAPRPSSSISSPPPPPPPHPPTEKPADVVVGDAESTVINMLAPFLKPPTPQPHPSSSDDPELILSYRSAHHGSSKDLLSAPGLPMPSHPQRHPDPSPTRSIPSGKFEPLPWEWFNTPKPARGDNTPHSAAGMSPITPGLPGGKFGDDPFSAGPSTPIRTSMDGGFPRVNSHGSVRAADLGINLSGGATAESAHRAALLQTFGSAGGMGMGIGRPPSTSSAARTSPFSQWGEHKSINTRQQQQQHHHQHHHQQQQTQTHMGAPPGLMMPHSSSAGSLSQFSHPSSLYHGTPGGFATAAGGHGQGQSYGGGGGGGYRDSQYHAQPSQRFFQADNTTSSYDEAILRAAYDGRK